MRISDKVKNKQGTIVWSITQIDPATGNYLLESDNGHGQCMTKWVSYSELFSSYVKVDNHTDDDQYDWFSGWAGDGLPAGTQEILKQDYCSHNWILYIGITESYEFCNKCDAKKEIEK